MRGRELKREEEGVEIEVSRDFSQNFIRLQTNIYDEIRALRSLFERFLREGVPTRDLISNLIWAVTGGRTTIVSPVYPERSPEPLAPVRTQIWQNILVFQSAGVQTFETPVFTPYPDVVIPGGKFMLVYSAYLQFVISLGKGNADVRYVIDIDEGSFLDNAREPIFNRRFRKEVIFLASDINKAFQSNWEMTQNFMKISGEVEVSNVISAPIEVQINVVFPGELAGGGGGGTPNSSIQLPTFQRLTTGQVDISDTPTLIHPEASDKGGIVVANLQAEVVYLGDQFVTPQTGFPLAPAGYFGSVASLPYYGPLFGVCDTGKQSRVAFIRFL